jgi:hypothetical protein
MQSTVFFKTILLFNMLLFFFQKVNAQETCNCLANLDTTIKKTELNYAGYPDMVNQHTQIQYKKLVEKLRAIAVRQSDPQKCFSILKTYVTYFNDKHFDLEYSETDSSVAEADFIKNFKSKKRDAVEGIWISPDSSLKLAVYKVDRENYKAVVLKSNDVKLRPGLVYYSFKKDKSGFTFNRYNWLTPDYPVRQRGGLLYVWNFELWGKVYPDAMSEAESARLLTWRNYNYGLDCEKLDEHTVLLSIGSFNRDNMVRELIEKNDSLIRSAKNLIVDLRGNGGGNTGWIHLMPYFYTQPIQQGEIYLRLSPENNQANLAGIQAMAEHPPTEPALKRTFTPEVIGLYKKAYLEIPKSEQVFYALPSLTLYADSVLKSPEKIALIFDDLGGSSTEFFFHISKQSSKVVRYGQHTLGMMDYMGTSQQTKLPFEGYYLLIPDKKSPWTATAPTNKSGFIPENKLSNVPWEQWIDHVKDDLERR